MNGGCVTTSPGEGDPSPWPDGGEGDSTGPGDSPGDSAGDAVETGDGAEPDLEGPAITIVEPCEYCIVAGRIDIVATITDASGIDADSVVATVANTYELPMTAGAVGTYRAEFDTRTLGNTLYPSVEVVAADQAGNRSSAGYEFALDNAPPRVALSSAQVRMTRKNGAGEWECSHPFDPLDTTAARHGDVAGAGASLLIYPRARIEDQNASSYISESSPVAGVRAGSTRLYILDSTGLQAGHRLTIAGAGGRCRINPDVEPDPVAPQPDQALVQALVPVPPSGVPNFTPGGAVLDTCIDGEVTDPPNSICDNLAAMNYWLHYTAAKAPAVYVLNFYDPSSCLYCAGGPFDTRNIADGPVCMAATASDDVGNAAVSLPIAICVDKDGSGDCAGFTGAGVACSDGCASPGFPTSSIVKM